MIRAILVDDEKHALESLEILLELNFPGKFQILAKCSSVAQALPAIQKIDPDLVFWISKCHSKMDFPCWRVFHFGSLR